MNAKPYKAKTLRGAEARVRLLEKQLRNLDELAGKFMRERELLAMLCADGPCFDNPLHAMAAKNLRDEVLRGIWRKPDGTPLK